MKKYTRNRNWNFLTAFGGSEYAEASAENNKKTQTGKNREARAGVFGRAGPIEATRIQDKKDGKVGRRNIRRETMSKKKKRELRGIQVNAGVACRYFTEEQFRDLIVGCHLGSLIITKDELLDYLEQRENVQTWKCCVCSDDTNPMNTHIYCAVCYQKLEAENEALKEYKDIVIELAELAEREVISLKDAAAWRNVQEELPENDGLVLVYSPSKKKNTIGLRAFAWHDPKKGWSSLPDVWLGVITHWQPLPVPPVNRDKEKQLRPKISEKQ